MGIRATERALALAIFGIVVSLILSMLAAAKAPTQAILTSAGVTLTLIILLYSPELRRFTRDAKEERERRKLRRARRLRVVSGVEADMSPYELPDGVFGYEVIFAVAGLRSGTARIKPDRTNPEGYPYPLEVHKFNGETWLVGYIAANVTEDQDGYIDLWMRRKTRSDQLVEISLARLEDDGESRGDRSWDSSAKNIFRLKLNARSFPTILGHV